MKITGSDVTVIFAILASSVVVLGGLVAVTRAIFRFAVDQRDNTRAVKSLTGKLEQLTTNIDGRFDALAARVTDLERRRGPEL